MAVDKAPEIRRARPKIWGLKKGGEPYLLDVPEVPVRTGAREVGVKKHSATQYGAAMLGIRAPEVMHAFVGGITDDFGVDTHDNMPSGRSSAATLWSVAGAIAVVAIPISWLTISQAAAAGYASAGVLGGAGALLSFPLWAGIALPVCVVGGLYLLGRHDYREDKPARRVYAS